MYRRINCACLLLIGTLFYTLLTQSPCFSQEQIDREEKQEYEELGLSQTEWEKYKASGMSKKKLKELIRLGISINEYLSKPWIALGLSEDQWLKRRRAGLNQPEMEIKTVPKEFQNSDVILSFLLPGFGQYKVRQTRKGLIYSGAGGTFLLLTFLLKSQTSNPIQGNKENKIPGKINPFFPVFYGVTGAISAIDYYRTTFYSNNLNLSLSPEAVRMSVSFSF